MADAKLPMEGGCRCGRVRFSITAAPLLTTACHCRGCQRMTASAYSLSVGVAPEGFRLTQGTPVLGGCHAPAAQHWHCDYCKSWLYTVPGGMEDQLVNVRATMLDDPYWFTPFVEVETAEKLPFAATGAPHSYERIPPAEEWGRLVQAFATQASMPT